MDPVVVEVMGRHGRVLHRVRLTSFPASVGRGYDCDVILDNPLVSPSHARLEIGEGGLRLRDQGSLNGLLDDRGARHEVIEGEFEVRATLGRTLLRIRSASFPVTPAVEDAERDGPIRRLLDDSRRMGVAASCAVVLFFFLVVSKEHDEQTWTTALAATLGLLAGACMWSALWSLLGRLLADRFRFVLHLCTALCMLGLSAVLSEAVDVATFAGYLGSGAAASWVLRNGVVFAFLWLHFRIVGAPRPRWRLVLALAGLLPFVAFDLVDHIKKPEFEATVRVRRDMYPVPAPLMVSGPVSELNGLVGRVADRADELADGR